MDDLVTADAAAAVDLPSVLWIGPADGLEFQSVFQWLQSHARLTAALTFHEASDHLAAGDVQPELIVLAETCQGDFSAADVGQLRAARRWREFANCSEAGVREWLATASRWVECCVYRGINGFREWRPNSCARAAGHAPSWSLPVTATDDERLLTLKPDPRRRDRGLLAVSTRQGELARTICDACPTRGWAGIWLRGRRPYLSGIRAIVWDVPHTAADWNTDLAELHTTAAPIIALVNFPRSEMLEQLAAAGVAATVSKPFWLDDLFGQLERL